MVVLQVIPSPCGGGAEMIVRQLVQEICSDDYRVELLYFNSPIKNDISKSLLDGVSLNIPSRNPLAIFKLRSFFKNMLKVDDNLVVHAHLTWPLYYVAIASIGLKMRLVYTEHSTYNKRRKLPFVRIVERFIYDRYNRVFCISEGVHSSLEGWLGNAFKSKLIMIQNGGRLYQFLERKNISIDGGIKLVSVGSLKKMKGFQVIIESLLFLKKSVSKYTIVGEGPMLDELQKLVAVLSLEKVVEFIGWSDDLEQYYHAADIQVIPSEWEGFGLVAVEGMSTGLPIIASNVDGLREVLNPKLESISLVDEFRSSEDWAEAIKKMIYQLPKKSNEWSYISRKQAEIFGVGRMLNSYKKQYQALN